MKSLILAVVGVGVLVGACWYLNRTPAVPVAAAESGTEPASVSNRANETDPVTSAQEQPKPSAAQAARAGRDTAPASVSGTAADWDSGMLLEAVDLLVSLHANYGQKQATWKRLMDAGKLDQVIAELEQRVTADPRTAEYPAALGQAYLKKCATIQDVREQGMLALQADKLFDTALGVDPANWEARFTKAVALSYWPASMGKGEEVVQHFQTLIQQQEAQTSQPHFADSYVLLGDHYQKTGHSDEARAVWERGAGVFPNNETLRNKLATPSVAQNSVSAAGQ